MTLAGPKLLVVRLGNHPSPERKTCRVRVLKKVHKEDLDTIFQSEISKSTAVGSVGERRQSLI